VYKLFCELFRVSILIVDPFTSSLIKGAFWGVSISDTSSIASFGLSGDVILKRWINFTGEDGTFSGEEVAVVVVVGVVVYVVAVVVVMDAAVVLHEVWDGLSNRFIKLSLLNCPSPAAVCIGNLGGSSFSFNWSTGRRGWLPRPILMSGFFFKIVTSTVLASKVAATQVLKADNRKTPLLSLKKPQVLKIAIKSPTSISSRYDSEPGMLFSDDIE
jgi:hypothetical protein